MDQTWDFITKHADKNEQSLLIKSAQKCGLLDNQSNFTDVIKILNNKYNTYSYNDYLNAIAKHYNLPDSNDETELIARIVKSELMHSDKLRLNFCKEERFVSSDPRNFSVEFNTRFKTSRLFRLRIPVYGLSLALSNEISDSASTIDFSPSAAASIAAVGATLFGGPIGMIGGLSTAALMFAKKHSKKKQPAGTDRKCMAFHLMIMYVHSIHSQKIETLDAAKAYIKEMINLTATSVSDTTSAATDYCKWSDTRLFILHTLLEHPAKDKIQPEISRILSLDIMSYDNKTSELFPKYKIKQLLNFKYELIDYLYGIDATATDVANFAYCNSQIENDAQPILYIDYKFPYTKISHNAYFYVPATELQKKALVKVYLEINGIDSETHCITSLSDCNMRFSYIQIFSKAISGTIMRLQAENATFVSPSSKNDNPELKSEILELKIEKILSEKEIKGFTTTLKEKEARIQQLEQDLQQANNKIDQLKDDLQAKEAIFKHMRHDVGKLFGPIHFYLGKYIENSSDIHINELKTDLKATLKRVQEIENAWKVFDAEKLYLKPSIIKLSELCKPIFDWPYIISIDNPESLNVDVEFSEDNFKSIVLANILSNLEKHAFHQKEKNSKIKISVYQ